MSQTVNPATQQVLATVPTVEKAHMDDEVAPAERALFMWRDVPGSTRYHMLLKLANLLAEDRDNSSLRNRTAGTMARLSA